MTRPRGRPARPVLARIAEWIRGMHYDELLEHLSKRDLPNDHWDWMGPLDVYGGPYRRKRGGIDRGRPTIVIANRRHRVDRILFAHWVNDGEPLDPRIQVRSLPECDWHLCVNPKHKRLHPLLDRKSEDYPPLPPLYTGTVVLPTHDEIADLVNDIYEHRHLPLAELEERFEDFSRDEIVEALRRINQ